MRKLYLIRHGHTIDNENFRYSGFSDCDLSEVGRKQVKQLTEYLKQFDVDKIYASTSKRTSQTIGDFAELKKKDIVLMEDLREMNFGIFDGLNLEEIKSKYPKEASEMMMADHLYSFPKGENIAQMYARNVSAFNEIMRESKDFDSVMVCAHMGTIRNLLSHLVSDSYDLHWHFKVGNASVSEIEFYDKFPVIETMGYIPYDRELIRTFPRGK